MFSVILLQAFPGGLIWIVAVLCVVGVLLWGLSQFPIDPTIYNFIRVAIIVVVAIWFIWFIAGIFGGGGAPVGLYRR